VTQNGRLTGMVTDRDIALRFATECKDPIAGTSAEADLARGGDDTQTGQVVHEVSE
jgi:CBS domain-containing protein